MFGEFLHSEATNNSDCECDGVLLGLVRFLFFLIPDKF